MKKHSFLHGALILTLGTVVVKLVGALFKVPLANVITENGTGFFGTAYQFYAVIFSLATGGFPVAIAKLVAENYALGRYNDVRGIKRVSMPIFLVAGTVGTLCMVFGAGIYADTVKNTGAYLPVLALAPSVFFCCVSSLYRGYYEGLRNMYPTAVSEVLEAVIKLAVGLTGAIVVVSLCAQQYTQTGTIFGIAMHAGTAALTTYSYGAAAAIFGVTLGSIFSMVYLVWYYRKKGDGICQEMYRAAPRPRSAKAMAKKLLYIAIPVGIGALAMSVGGLIDTIVLQKQLGRLLLTHGQQLLAGYGGLIPLTNLENTATIPNFLFGCYTNGLTVYMLVPAFTQAFGVSALPSLTQAWTKGNRQEIKTSIESILRITGLFAIPAGLGITTLAQPIAALLFGYSGGAQITGRVLVVLGIAAIFSAVSTPISAMLQAVGRVDLPVKFMLAALVVKTALTFVLCGVAQLNLLGAAIGTLVCFLVVTILQLAALVRVSKVQIDWAKTFVKPLLCALAAVVLAFGIAQIVEAVGFGMRLACLAGMLTAVFIYTFFLLFSKTLTKIDILMLPNGENIAKLLEKRGWIG